MTDIEIYNALADGDLTPEEAVDQLVALGAARDDAQFIIDLQIGKVKRDVIGLD